MLWISASWAMPSLQLKPYTREAFANETALTIGLSVKLFHALKALPCVALVCVALWSGRLKWLKHKAPRLQLEQAAPDTRH